MDFKEPSSQGEATEALAKLRHALALPDSVRADQAFEWLEKLDGRWDQLHAEVLSVMADLVESHPDADLWRRVAEYLKKNVYRCKGDVAKFYVGIAVLMHLLNDDATTMLAASILSASRAPVYKDEPVLASVIEMFKAKLMPKMKELADAKRYSEALALWRALIRFTGFEKVPTTVTNGVLHIATLAFKETDPAVHIEAFRSWRVLVESLPRQLLKKAAYIKLLLNPLNRVYRDTDAVTTSYKFAAWWQLVLSLNDELEPHFDDVVFPLLNKIFGIPSAKARQVNPAAFASPTRELPSEAYALLALILYKGNVDIASEMSKLCDQFPINEHTIKDACFAKHRSLLEEIFALVLNNIVRRVTPPVEGYPYVLAKILLSRITSLYDGGHHGLVRTFLSMIYKLIQAKLFDTEQMLSVYTDLANGVPQKVMGSSQFNLREGSSSMHECPVMSLTAFFVQHVAGMCDKDTDSLPSTKVAKHKRTFRHLLKVLLECGSASMNFLHFTDHVSRSLAQAEGVPHMDSWLEVADHLSSFIRHTHEVNQGGSLEHDFSALINTLKYPFRPNLNLTADVVKKWTELFTVFAIDAALVKDVGVNQHIEELCAHLLEELSATEFDLNRLMLCGQAFETVVKQACLETVTIGKKIPLGNLHSLVKCVALLANRGHEFIQNKKQLKANCQFFITILNIGNLLMNRANNVALCRQIMICIIPELTPLIEHTKNKGAMRDTSLTLVELPLLHSLAQFAETFVCKAEKASQGASEKFAEMVRVVVEHGGSHWKNNIREIFVRYAKSLSVSLAEPDQSLSQSLSQVVVIPDVVLPPGGAQVKSAAPTVKPVVSGATAKRRSTRKSAKDDDQEFTPIKTAKKKSIFTEHQLEKQSESKILPSMYQDLSQSLDNKPNAQNAVVGNPVLMVEPLVVAPIVDEDAVFNDITPKKIEAEPDIADDVKRTSRARRSLAEAGKDTTEAEWVKPIGDSSEVDDVKETCSSVTSVATPTTSLSTPLSTFNSTTIEEVSSTAAAVPSSAPAAVTTTEIETTATTTLTATATPTATTPITNSLTLTSTTTTTITPASSTSTSSSIKEPASAVEQVVNHVPVELSPLPGDNNENEEPVTKKKKRFSYSETDEMLEPPIVIDQQPPSLTKMIEKMQSDQQEREKDEAMQLNSPLRPQGARKRKLSGQPIESPITAKLQQRNFLINSPSSRSRKMLEAAQARHTMATTGNTLSPAAVENSRHSVAGSTPRCEKPQMGALCDASADSGDGEISRATTTTTTTAATTTTPALSSSSSSSATNRLFATPMSPSVGRSILKRVSTGASAKKVSFSRSTEVCAYNKHPRVSTAKSLFPPVMVHTDANSSAEIVDQSAKLENGTTTPAAASTTTTNTPASTTTTNTPAVAEAEADKQPCPLGPPAGSGEPAPEVIIVDDGSADESFDGPSPLDVSVVIHQDDPVVHVSTVSTSVESDATTAFASAPDAEHVEATSRSVVVEPTQRGQGGDEGLSPASTAPTEEKVDAVSATLVDAIKSVRSDHLPEILDFIASTDFIKTLSPQVRGTFFSKCLTIMSSYQCHH